MMFGPHKKISNSGFTLVEAIIYFSVLLVAAAAAIAAFLSYGDILKEIKVRTVLSDTAQTTLERVTREVRNADGVDPFETVVDNAAGSLGLINIDSDDVNFSLLGSQLMLAIDGTPTMALTPDNVSVDEFWVYEYTTGNTILVRVALTLTASSSDYATTETFYGGAVLRGSYD